MNARLQQLSLALSDILRKLTTEYCPEKVILFGSLANDDVSEWSDLDLVVIKETPKTFPQRLREVALLCRPTVGVDFLVYTPEEFAQMIADQNPFIVEEVVRKGRVLYERRPNSGVD